MKLNTTNIPRTLMWTAAAVAATALVSIIVIQILTITLTTRPPMLTRWLTGLFVICQQGILASIGLAVAGFALHSTRPQTTTKVMIAEVAPTRPTFQVAQAVEAPRGQAPLPSDLRAAIAQASGKGRR